MIKNLSEEAYRGHLQTLEQLNASRAEAEFWKGRAMAWMNELLKRGAIRATYDPVYALVRDTVISGYEKVDPELFKKIAKENPNVDVGQLVGIAAEFGFRIELNLEPKK